MYQGGRLVSFIRRLLRNALTNVDLALDPFPPLRARVVPGAPIVETWIDLFAPIIDMLYEVCRVNCWLTFFSMLLQVIQKLPEADDFDSTKDFNAIQKFFDEFEASVNTSA